ncbi:MAG: serine--tRNA ligase [Rhodospirillaceae bacterium]|jgi:seryl-tRNA synthetase|nr:serine--tRNA ligase [Rhodospirillaceae bacterium]
MHDLKWIRDNPEAFDAGLARMGLEPHAKTVIDMYARHRGAVTQLQGFQTERNELSKKIGLIKKDGGDATEVMAQVSAKKEEMTRLEEDQRFLADEIRNLLLGIPNLLHADVPEGLSEDDNVELSRHGEPRQFNFETKDHIALGASLGGMDFETAAAMSGARFVVLSGPLARLERALAQFMLNTHTEENGYTEVNPPVLVKDEALIGTGQLPKFGEDLYRTQDDLWLIPTAEVSLTNIVANKILTSGDLPLRFTAFTPCFRQEAGAAGKDTRGMIRHHQFEKVEMVSIVADEESEAELDRMTGCAAGILQKLKLPYRVMALSAGDIGFSAHRTYDLEVWLPGQDCYREISSCSNCQDFQARRMGARYKPEEGAKGTRPVHTLNGSGLAVGRTLVAVLENYQQADGSVVVPEVLLPYMGGLETIPAQEA